jgi:hypothetical protein
LLFGELSHEAKERWVVDKRIFDDIRSRGEANKLRLIEKDWRKSIDRWMNDQ